MAKQIFLLQSLFFLIRIIFILEKEHCVEDKEKMYYSHIMNITFVSVIFKLSQNFAE